MDVRELLRTTAYRYVLVKLLLQEEGVTEETPGYKEQLAQLIEQYDGRSESDLTIELNKRDFGLLLATPPLDRI